MLSIHRYLRVVNENEKVHDGQASEKIHPPMVLVPSLTSAILLQILTFSAMQASPGAYNPSLVFTSLYYTLSLMRCALSKLELVKNPLLHDYLESRYP
jgi:hypothetical protein